MPVENIEQVNEAKVLGLIINSKFNFNSHIQLQCSQRLYLIKLLRKQGLPAKQLNIVFRAIILSIIQYTISAWGGFIHAEWKHKIDAFLTRANSSGLCTDLNFDSLLFAADQTLFKSIHYNDHCLHSILHQVKPSQYRLRDRGHKLTLPEYRTLFYKKKSFTFCYLFETV
jgi:hypothetical protein